MRKDVQLDRRRRNRDQIGAVSVHPVEAPRQPEAIGLRVTLPEGRSLKNWKILLIGVAVGVAVSDPEIMTMIRSLLEEYKKEAPPSVVAPKETKPSGQ